MDPIIGGALIGAGSSFLGGMMANGANRDAANVAYEQNRAMTIEQMKFQEQMRATSHQQEVADLQAAGLNPMLSVNAGSGGASGASLSNAPAKQENPLEGVASTALQAMQMKLQASKQAEEINLLRAQKSKTNMETNVLSKSIPQAEAANMGWDWVKDKLKSGAKNIDLMREYADEEPDRIKLRMKLKEQELNNNRKEFRNNMKLR